MAILSKGLKPDNKVHSSLELGLTNIRGLCSNFVECQSFSLNQTLVALLLYVRQAWITQIWQFLCEGLSSFNLIGYCHSYIWSYSLKKGFLLHETYI